MLKKILPLFLFLFAVNLSIAQHKVRIVEEKGPNRLNLMAYNESETDYDVAIEVTGTNFRQKSAKKLRFTRVPASSKVLLHTLILLKGKKPVYTYELTVNDSLSRRSLQREFEPIKIPPPKSITVYVKENCKSCDSLTTALSNGPYIFSLQSLTEKPEIKEQLSRALANSKTPMDSVQNAIVNLGGILHTDIESYDQLLEALKKEE